MKIYDISQEVFTSEVYPRDPAPNKISLSSIAEGGLYNLTAFSMCAHNGTHVDAPRHFIADGESVDEIPLYKSVGLAYVAEHKGALDAIDAEKIIKKAFESGNESKKRILIKGECEISDEAALLFADAELYLIGTESQSVGKADAPMKAHRALLSAGVVLLEGLRLGEVREGVYFLSAAPLKLGGADGAPCRAILIEGLL